MAQVTIRCKYFFSFLSLTRPRILINGITQPIASWSNPNVYTLPAGVHNIKIYLPYPILMFQTSIAKASISLGENDTIIFHYKLPSFIFLPGQLVLISHKQKERENIQNNDAQVQIQPAGKCPQCKNPNSKNLKICEWCGHQIS